LSRGKFFPHTSICKVVVAVIVVVVVVVKQAGAYLFLGHFLRGHSNNT